MTFTAPLLCHSSCCCQLGQGGEQGTDCTTERQGPKPPTPPQGKETQTRPSGGLCGSTASGGISLPASENAWSNSALQMAGTNQQHPTAPEQGSACPPSETPQESRSFLLQRSGQQSSWFQRSNNSLQCPSSQSLFHCESSKSSTGGEQSGMIRIAPLRALLCAVNPWLQVSHPHSSTRPGQD